MLTLWCHRIFHLTVFCMYFFALYRHHFIPHLSAFLGPYKYLTIWNLITHTFVFGLFTVNNFLPVRMKLRKKLIRFGDTIFTSVAVPYGMFVVCTFWTLFSINRELIFPVQLEKVYPFWLNHLAHTCILPVSLLEMYISHHPHRSRKLSYSLLLAVGACYTVLLLALGLGMNLWVYPVLQVLNWPMRITFMVLSLVFLVIFHTITEGINSLFWSRNSSASSKRK